MQPHPPSLGPAPRTTLHVLLALLLFATLPALPQTNDAPSGPPANRYLLVLETSRSMQRRGPAALNALSDLLNSGFHGQLHAGDSIGVWTCNDKVHTGQLPLQHWSPQTQTTVATRILAFFNEQKYEKEADLDKLLPALFHVVQASPFITVVLVTDGEDKIRGTPYDSKINETFQTWSERQQKADMPFLTILRGKEGKLTDCTITPAPWQAELPPLPPELRVSQVAAQKEPPAPKSTVPPLIFHGKNPEPARTASATNSIAAFAAATNSGQTSPDTNSVPAAAHLTATPNSVAPLAAKAQPSSEQAPKVAADSEPAPAPTNPPASLTVSKPTAPSTNRLASAPPFSPASEATVLPPATRSKRIWFAAAAIGTALLGLTILLLARARPAPTASLITRSLERKSR